MHAVFAIAGAVLAVVLTEFMVRVRTRRHAIEAAALELALLLPNVVVPISEAWDESAYPRPDTTLGSPWAEQRGRIVGLLGRVRADARWPLRRAAKIRAEVDDLSARLYVAESEWLLNRNLIPWVKCSTPRPRTSWEWCSRA